MLYSDFNYDTSIVLNATFFLVYESQVYTSSFVLQNVHDYFKKKERGGSSHHHILIQSPQVVCAKEGKTKPKHIKSRRRSSKISTIKKAEEDGSTLSTTSEYKVGHNIYLDYKLSLTFVYWTNFHFKTIYIVYFYSI